VLLLLETRIPLSAREDLAVTYRNQGQWDDALKLQEKILEATTRVLGEEQPDTLRAMANLARAYWRQRWWDDALKLDEKVSEARTRVLEKQHPDTLRSLKNIQKQLVDVCSLTRSYWYRETIAFPILCDPKQRQESTETVIGSLHQIIRTIWLGHLRSCRMSHSGSDEL
jgi:uncharacterized protein (DUF2267 family)